MKGLVLFSDGSYALRDVPEPVLGGNVYAPRDVLIEVAYCGICGSDVHKWKDSDKQGVSSPTSAVVTGHEIVGTVKAVGSEVTDVKAGDRVVCELVTFYCGRCINCQTGRINICCNMPSMQQRAHYVTGGGYARYTVWPARHVHVLPPEVSLEEGTLIEPTAGGPPPVAPPAPRGDERPRLALARQFGADAVINVEKVDLVNRVKEISG